MKRRFPASQWQRRTSFQQFFITVRSFNKALSVTSQRVHHLILLSLMFCVCYIDTGGQLAEPERPGPQSQLPERLREALWDSAKAPARWTCGLRLSHDWNMLIDTGDTTRKKLLVFGKTSTLPSLEWHWSNMEAVYGNVGHLTVT